MQEILSNDNSDTILYFYWGLGSAEILPLIDVSKFKKVVVRMHRYDLYEYENDNYIPFRKQLLNKKLIVLPCSDDGTNHLKSIYKNFKATIQTQRLGVIQQKKVSTGSSGDLIRIVSCSSLVEVKRVDKMLKVASELNIPFVWVHIGGGQLQAKLQKEIIELNIKDKFILIGEINSELIIEFLVNGNFDLFVNTSRSEGVPVSIMEAFSVGIPVIATDAGGTREIVDETVGHLMENDFDHNDLKDSIERYNNLSKEEKNQLRQNAITRCYNKCNMEKLTLELVEILNK
jgi:glycosyltransferase involved in cell wall biosynthesis